MKIQTVRYINRTTNGCVVKKQKKSWKQKSDERRVQTIGAQKDLQLILKTKMRSDQLHNRSLRISIPDDPQVQNIFEK